MKKKDNALRTLALVSSFAFTMIVIIVGGVLLGITLDNLLNTNVLFTIIFSILGIVGGLANLIRNVSKLED